MTHAEFSPRTSRSQGLIVYFVLTYLFSWGILIPEALAARELIPFHLPVGLLLAAGYSPAIAAVIAALREGGSAALSSLVGRLLRLRVGAVWYAVAVFVPVLILLGGRGLEGLLGGSPPPIAQPSLMDDVGFAGSPLAFAAIMLIYNLIVTVGEELGWRGYALPRLQRHLPALRSGLVLGLIWGLWHLPLAWTPATRSAIADLPLWGFVVDVVAMSVIYVWIFNNTRGSLFVALVVHAVNNTAAIFLMPATAISTRQFLLTAGVRVVTAALVVLIFGADRLSRKASLDLE
jgi:membrane protease YdiL (CAAX protease family)